MILNEDIAKLFASMRAMYGGMWRHGAEVIPIWRSKLSHCSEEDIRRAVAKSMEHYKSRPPTLPQFIELTKRQESTSTYLPPPPGISHAMRALNVELLGVLQTYGGVDSFTLRQLVLLKNSLCEENGAETIPDEKLDDARRQFIAVIGEYMDEEKRQKEIGMARQRVQRGVPAYGGW